MDKEAKLLALRCPGCGAALAITDTYRCDCEYCFSRYVITNLPEIVQAVRERRRVPEADYFYKGSVESRSFPYGTVYPKDRWRE